NLGHCRPSPSAVSESVPLPGVAEVPRSAAWRRCRPTPTYRVSGPGSGCGPKSSAASRDRSSAESESSAIASASTESGCSEVGGSVQAAVQALPPSAGSALLSSLASGIPLLDTLGVIGSSPIAPINASRWSSGSYTPSGGRKCGIETRKNAELFRNLPRRGLYVAHEEGDTTNPVRHDICATTFSRKSLIFSQIALALAVFPAHR